MKKILQLLSCLLLSLLLYSQSNISEAEARALMEDYLNYCLLDQHPVLYQRYFDLDAEQDEDYALFDQDGQMVIPPVYEGYPMYTSTGHLIVKKRGFTGVIDQSGKAILPFIFDEIDEYWSSGLFLVSYRGRTGLIRIPKKQNK